MLNEIANADLIEELADALVAEQQDPYSQLLTVQRRWPIPSHSLQWSHSLSMEVLNGS